MKGKGCLIAAAVALGFITIFLALAGPTILREGGRLYEPIAKMKGAQTDFETWSDAHAFQAPSSVAATAEQVDRFLRLRRRLGEVDDQNPLPVEGIRRNQRPDLAQIEGLLEGVGGAVTGRMDAYREVGMHPDEYRYLERVIYRLWLRPLRAKGLDPAAVARAAREILDLAASEKDRAIATRLRDRARNMSERHVLPPDGIPVELHTLLMTRAAEVDDLIDAGSSRPTRGGRAGPDF